MIDGVWGDLFRYHGAIVQLKDGNKVKIVRGDKVPPSYWAEHASCYTVAYVQDGKWCPGDDLPSRKVCAGGVSKNYDESIKRAWLVAIPLEYFKEEENEWGQVSP